VLTLQDVRVFYGAIQAVKGISLEVRERELVTIVGANGAGKTTTLRTIMGLWQASAGRLLFEGAPIEQLDTPSIARLGIAYVPETMGIFSQLTVRENMLLATGSGGFDDDRRDGIFALFPALRQKWDSAAGSLSGGQKQMLAVGRAIVEPRRLLVVDEPTKGLAPAIIEHLIEAFLRLKETETTILLVEQNFHMARSVGDDVAVMDDGRIVHTGSMADLAADETLQHRLLGLSLASHQ
jgi:branched-chain amino acid transport system ATP-binding protein